MLLPLTAGCLNAIEGPAELIPRTLVYRPRAVTVEANQLLVDGTPFLVKGVLYNPVPPGVDPGQAGGWNVVDHPEVYREDFRLMKEMGVNTIRIVNTTGNIPAMMAFLDEASRFGLNVILGHQGPMGSDPGDDRVRERFLDEVRTIVDAYRLHPALLLWVLGEEMNGQPMRSVDTWYTLLDEAARLTKRLDGNHPIATANQGVTDLLRFRQLSPSVDIFGLNTDLVDPTGWRQWVYPGYYTTVSDRPILVTSFGVDALDAERGAVDEATQARLLRENWDEIALQAQGGFNQSIGGVVNEWSDSWWRRGSPNAQDLLPDWVPREGSSVLPDGTLSSEWFGIVAHDPVTGKRVPREAYRALKQAWTDPSAGSPPALASVRTEKIGNAIKVTADVVTYGGIPVNVTLKYRLKADAWRELPMTLENGTYVATLGPFDGIAILFYSVIAVDAAGRTMESAGHAAREVPSTPPLGSAAAALGTAALLGLLARARQGVRRQ
ncbi:MAG TPA: glycoside hydrolase family 2 TIM barrel-domain containing protein [Candidatus Thermoplasmatota archaeon]|nr:glycoside hydrolase family 2 TIM barrel-domain containing protein [Candidatus Thermoplasmatota archaeon]